MDDFDEEAEPRFIENFNLLKDEIDGEGIVTKRKSIPHDVKPGELPKVVRDAIGELETPAISALNTMAEKTGSHILLHEHGNNRGKIIALGL